METFTLISTLCKVMKKDGTCSKNPQVSLKVPYCVPGICNKENCIYLKRYPALNVINESLNVNGIDIKDKRIVVSCKTCGNESKYTLQQLADFSINKFKFFRSDRQVCCGFTYKEKYGSVAYNIIPRYIYDKDGKKFYLRTHHEAICENNHKFLIKKDIKNPKCKICECEQKFEFFKVLKEFKVKYKVVEIYGNFNARTRDNKNMKELKNCVIGLYTGSSKKITGRIVFNDIIRTRPINMQNDKTPIKWFDDYDKLIDREYCIEFLMGFFKELYKK